MEVFIGKKNLSRYAFLKKSRYVKCVFNFSRGGFQRTLRNIKGTGI